MNGGDGDTGGAWGEAELLCTNPDNAIYTAKRQTGGEAVLMYYAVINRGTPVWRIEDTLHRYKALAAENPLMPIHAGRIGGRPGGGYEVVVYAPALERFDPKRHIRGVADAWACATALINAVAALHAVGVAHGNIGTGNLYYDKEKGLLLFGQLFPRFVGRAPTGGGAHGAAPGYKDDLRALGHTVRTLMGAAYDAPDSAPCPHKYVLPSQAVRLIDALCEDEGTVGDAAQLKRDWAAALSRVIPPGRPAEQYGHLSVYTSTFDPAASIVFAPTDAERFTVTALSDMATVKRRRRALAVDCAAVLAALASVALYILLHMPSLPHYGAL